MFRDLYAGLLNRNNSRPIVSVFPPPFFSRNLSDKDRSPRSGDDRDYWTRRWIQIFLSTNNFSRAMIRGRDDDRSSRTMDGSETRLILRNRVS